MEQIPPFRPLEMGNKSLWCKPVLIGVFLLVIKNTDAER
jgi:hypothetical protein